MNNMFIKTTDADTANELMTQGFQFVSNTSGVFTFLNNTNLKFDKNNKNVVFSNKLSM